MKKFLSILSALILCVGIFVGCDTLQTPDDGGNDDPPAVVSPLIGIGECYEKIQDASAIKQTIAITSGKITQYESSKTYTKEGSSYRVTGTAKRLNDITEEQPYSETVINETVAAGEFDVRLKFDELYYSSWNVENNTLTAVIKDSSVGLALGLSGSLPAPVRNMQMTVKTDGTRAERIDIEYVSGNSTVTIALEFTY